MKKLGKIFVCQSCGRQESRWLGRCPACGAWNSFIETTPSDTATGQASNESAPRKESKLTSLNDIDAAEARRLGTGLTELDRCLGGGLVKGSVVLLGGEPGIGKSTLTLQLLDQLQTDLPLVLVAGEESAAQVKLRSRRLGITRNSIMVIEETRVGHIEEALRGIEPGCVVVDSIQALRSPEAGDIPGTINQVKYGAYELSEWARLRGVPLIFIAHVTKGGLIAGPKTIEHLVDTVLQFEEAEAGLRLLRALKNRFGSVDELGLFRMEESGLVEVSNPSQVFLHYRSGPPPEGTAIAAVIEGSRALLVEVQALTVSAKAGLGRVTSDKIDSTRVQRVAAVIEKHLGLSFTDQDIYVNVGGGLRLTEPAVDLPLALALISARTRRPLKPGLCAAGELSLAAEVRSVGALRRRIKAAQDLGMKLFVCRGESEDFVHSVSKLNEVVSLLAESTPKTPSSQEKV